MEEIIINIDSRYRDTTLYNNPSKFKINFTTPYKNIVSIKVTSVEINNSISYIDSSKNNNFFTVHFPNKLNDDIGCKFELPRGLYQVITSITDTLNILFENIINSSDKLVNVSPERYFYIFYLNNNITIQFDFDDQLIISEGWSSVYGIYNQIKKYITTKYDEYHNYCDNNPSIVKQPLYYGQFSIDNIILNVFDVRYTNNIRTDTILGSTFINDLEENLVDLKTLIYSSYVSTYNPLLNDINNFSASTDGTGILDNICNYFKTQYPLDNYNIISNDNLDNYKYFLTNVPFDNKNELIQIYNMQVEIDSLRTIIEIKNDFTTYQYNCYYKNGGSITKGKITDFIINKHSLVKYIPDFEIDFNTFSTLQNSYSNGDFDIKRLNYETLGYYIGYRKSFYTSQPYNSDKVVEAEKFFNNAGEEYIFLKLNDWGYIDFFSQKLFAKFIMMPSLGNPYLEDNIICKEYKFIQPINISKLNIEMMDYLGNLVDFNGSDYSFTIEMKQIIHSDLKIYYDNKLLTN
jgi:hypothetical protein